jgi:hypothetical protein
VKQSVQTTSARPYRTNDNHNMHADCHLIASQQNPATSGARPFFFYAGTRCRRTKPHTTPSPAPPQHQHEAHHKDRGQHATSALAKASLGQVFTGCQPPRRGRGGRQSGYHVQKPAPFLTHMLQSRPCNAVTSDCAAHSSAQAPATPASNAIPCPVQFQPTTWTQGSATKAPSKSSLPLRR